MKKTKQTSTKSIDPMTVKKWHDAGKKSWETRRFNIYLKAKKRSDAGIKAAATRRANKALMAFK